MYIAYDYAFLYVYIYVHTYIFYVCILSQYALMLNWVLELQAFLLSPTSFHTTFLRTCGR